MIKQLPLYRKIHKWLALLLGLQLALWTLSGFMFSILPHDKVSGEHLVATPEPDPVAESALDPRDLLARFPDLQGLARVHRFGQDWWLANSGEDVFLIDPASLESVAVTEADILALATDIHVGDSEATAIILETDTTLENRRFELPVWKVDFADEENSSLYFSSTGGYLGIKTDTWRLFDVFWMLHIMDYAERQSFNNALIIFVAVATLFTTLTGVLLIFGVFRKQDFLIWQKLHRAPVQLSGTDGYSSQLFARKNRLLFDVLGEAGFDLPSSCGGGGNCGLCRVRLDHSDSFDRERHGTLSDEEFAQGYRLACQLRVGAGMAIELPEQVLHQQLYQCEVIGNRFLTPLIRELVIRLPDHHDFSFEAGEYIQLHCPPGKVALKDIERPAFAEPVWQALQLDSMASERKDPLKRAYSMANPPCEKSELRFLIRLGTPDAGHEIPGAVSSFVFSLKAGDRVDISGPFGYFHAEDSDQEMIFIGGGAGMAPLRSHILHQLDTVKTRRNIRYFYGARSADEIIYAEEFQALADTHDNFQWVVGLSENGCADADNYLTGWIHDVAHDLCLARHPDPASCRYYLCGPPAMLDATRAMLKKLGVPDSQVRYDDFGN